MKKRIVVIGSGLAGSLICNDLAESCEVILLEAGHKNRVAYPLVNYSLKHFGAVKTFCIGQGGTTNIWDNGLIPIQMDDVSSTGFDQVISAARPYTNKAAKRLYFGGKNYLTEYYAVRKQMNAIANRIGVFPDGVDCLLYPKKHRGLKINERVRAHYLVKGINFTSKNGRITTVRYVVGDKDDAIHPDAVVICAGALGSPALVTKLLLAAGCPTAQSGLGLADHPMGFVGKFKAKKGIEHLIRQMAYCDKGTYACRTAVRLKSDCGNYTCCAFFRPALTLQNRLSIYKYKSLLGASSGMARLKCGFSPKLFHPDILAEIYAHIFQTQIRSRIFNLLLLFEQKRGRSRVAYGKDTINVDWEVTQEEISIYNRILEKLCDCLEPLSDDLIIQMPLTDDWLWSAAHHSGTISLGDMPGDLVDKDLKLKNIENAYVCDGSIIQEHSYANTGLTIGQLAMRLADRLSH